METVGGIGAAIFGFSLTRYFSDPRLKLKPKIPILKFKAIEFLPNLKIKLRKSIIHIHHWIFFSILLGLLLYTTSSFGQLLLVKSFFFGGIIQGITYKDRFRIFY